MFRSFAILIVFGLLSIMSVKAQTSDKIVATVEYQFKYIKNGETIIDDIGILDIAGDKSYFHGKGADDDKKMLNERIARASNGSNHITLAPLSSKDFAQNACEFKIIKDYAKRMAVMVQYIGRQNLGFVKDTLSSRKWVIGKETKKIDGFFCRKATTRKDTSTITAWFTTEIPLPEGPYYYYGLPGLIVQVRSTAGISAELLRMRPVNQPREKIKTEPFALVTATQWYKAAANEAAAFKTGQFSNGDEAKLKSESQ